MAASLDPNHGKPFQSAAQLGGQAATVELPRVWSRSFLKFRLPFSTDAGDVYHNPFRAKRLELFVNIIDGILRHKPICRVIDLGGTVHYWNGLQHVWSGRNVEITIVNVSPPAEEDARFTYLQADARGLPDVADNAFDIVHSNSVLEHVGSWRDKQRMAGEVRRLAPRYFVQTPNYWFPFEPHMRSPIIHWLPRPVQRKIVSLRRCGFYEKASTMDKAQEILSDAEMLDRAEMETLFPDARLEKEKLGFLTKSWIAIR